MIVYDFRFKVKQMHIKCNVTLFLTRIEEVNLDINNMDICSQMYSITQPIANLMISSNLPTVQDFQGSLHPVFERDNLENDNCT